MSINYTRRTPLLREKAVGFRISLLDESSYTPNYRPDECFYKKGSDFILLVQASRCYGFGKRLSISAVHKVFSRSQRVASHRVASL